MIRNLIIVFLALMINSGKSQDKVYTSLKLSQNDKLKIEMSEINKVYSNGNMIDHDSSFRNYEIFVVAADENGYLIRWKSTDKNELEYSSNVPVEDLITDIIRLLEYDILIDKCGNVIDVSNWEEVNEQYMRIFRKLITNNDILGNDLRDKYIKRYKGLLNTKKKVLDVLKNNIDIIFGKFCQQYTLGKPKEETIETNISGKNNKKVSLGVISKVLSYEKDICIVDVEYKYDEQSLQKIKMDNIELSIKYKFDLEKGWLKSIVLNSRGTYDKYIVSNITNYKFF